MLQVHASSPSCKHTDPKALVGRSFLRLNQAGPGRGGTWWLVDLGPDHRLICNYYTLRQDASFDFPRDWYLQVPNLNPFKSYSQDMMFPDVSMLGQHGFESPPQALPAARGMVGVELFLQRVEQRIGATGNEYKTSGTCTGCCVILNCEGVQLEGH